MIYWNYIILVAAIILLSFMVWNEVKRANKSRLFWRILASVIAVTSLACIALSVSFTKTKDTDGTNHVILLTAGFDKDSVQSFLNRTSATAPVYTVDEEILNEAKLLKPNLVANVETIRPAQKTDVLHVFGYGLESAELDQLATTPIVFHPAKLTTGITTIDWQRTVAAGDRLRVQGQFNNTSPTDVKIVLKGLNTSLDSVVVSKNSSHSFELTTIPKHLSRAVYSVFAFAEKDTIEKEEIPVEVIKGKDVKVLMLASAPDFETKFLKNWLGENGYAVATRTRISKNKFQKDYINIQEQAPDRISAAMLDNFDILVADATELSSVTAAELNTIQLQVFTKGLGVIVKADSSFSRKAFYGRDFAINKARENNTKEVALSLKNGASNLKLPVEFPVYIAAGHGTQSLIKDNKTSVFAGSSIYGNGRVILSTLENTYSLLLSGQKNAYADIWTLLLSSAAKKLPNKETVIFNPALPIVNKPVEVSIYNSSYTQPAQLGEEKVYLQQNSILPFVHSGTYWPAAAGWLPQVDAEGKTNWMYVNKKNSWPVVSSVNKIASTTRWAAKNSYKNAQKEIKKEKVRVNVPPILFFLFFLFTVGFLWFEKKLSIT
jgi:hypothetical protein